MKAHAEGKTTPQKIQLFKSVCFPTCKKKALKTFHATGESVEDGADVADPNGADVADPDGADVADPDGDDFAGGARTAAEVLVFGVTWVAVVWGSTSSSFWHYRNCI